MTSDRTSSFETGLILKGAHKRIIWDCSWTADANILATGSRDGTCKIWKVSYISNNLLSEESRSGVSPNLLCLLVFSPFNDIPVTAIDMRHDKVIRSDDEVVWHCAIGSEYGDVSVYEILVKASSLVVSSDQTIYEDDSKSITPAKSIETIKCIELHRVNRSNCHGSAVQKIRWHPISFIDATFASCSDDRSIRIHSYPVSVGLSHSSF